MVVRVGNLPTDFGRNADLVCDMTKPHPVLTHEMHGDKDSTYLLVRYQCEKK
jgi:hypothetical protein